MVKILCLYIIMLGVLLSESLRTCELNNVREVNLGETWEEIVGIRANN